MVEILKEYFLLILVQFFVRGEFLREVKSVDGLISFLIEYYYEEIYFQGNFYFYGFIVKDSVLVILCFYIIMVFVYGIKGKMEEEY